MLKVVTELYNIIFPIDDSSVGNDSHLISAFRSWSHDVEDIIQNPQPSSLEVPSDEAVTEDESGTVESLSTWLLSTLFRVLLGETILSHDNSHRSLDSYPDIVDLGTRVLIKIKVTKDSIIQQLDNGCSSDDENNGEKILLEILRASQNWLRWYLQIYEPIQASRTGIRTGHSLISVWRSKDALEIYLLLIKQLSLHPSELGRYSSQLLFYSSYNPIAGVDEKLQIAYQYLANDCDMYTILLESMVQTELTTLQLSLVRVVHNALVSFPNTKRYVIGAYVDVESIPSAAPWISTGSPRKSMLDAFWDLTRFQLTRGSDVVFPGDKSNRRAELVVEIQRVFYALRVGTDIHVQSERGQLIIDLLSLDSTNDQCYDCQLAAICILMDSDPSFGETIASSDSVQETLLYTLETQINALLQKNQIDDGAAATMIPILAVLLKYCKVNSTIRQKTKDFLFPPSTEEEFQALATEELKRSSGRAKNMKPLDAPRDSMRWKIIQLMTFPHSFVKRLVGELLWTLCNDDRDMFVLRTGMGNALPFLGTKGLVQLPF